MQYKWIESPSFVVMCDFHVHGCWKKHHLMGSQFFYFVACTYKMSCRNLEFKYTSFSNFLISWILSGIQYAVDPWKNMAYIPHSPLHSRLIPLQKISKCFSVPCDALHKVNDLLVIFNELLHTFVSYHGPTAQFCTFGDVYYEDM